MNKLLEWKKKNNKVWYEMEKLIGVSEQTLRDIIRKRSPDIKVLTALKIKSVTGLDSWDYLDGLDGLKKIIQKK